MPPVLKVQSLKNWTTREVQYIIFFNNILLLYSTELVYPLFIQKLTYADSQYPHL